jgi:hypothetical protein
VARIRTVKPDFFTSSDVMDLSAHARLLYIGLWCEADREGRMAWRPASLKVRYLPHDDCDIEAVCGELLTARLVVLYGDGLAYIPTFLKHQIINGREGDSCLPAPEIARVPELEARVTDASLTRHVGRKEGRKEEQTTDCAQARESSPPTAGQLRLAAHELLDLWRQHGTGASVLPLEKLSGKEKRDLRDALDRMTVDEWESVFKRAKASDYLSGRDGKFPPMSLWRVLASASAILGGEHDTRTPTATPTVTGPQDRVITPALIAQLYGGPA